MGDREPTADELVKHLQHVASQIDIATALVKQIFVRFVIGGICSNAVTLCYLRMNLTVSHSLGKTTHSILMAFVMTCATTCLLLLDASALDNVIALVKEDADKWKWPSDKKTQNKNTLDSVMRSVPLVYVASVFIAFVLVFNVGKVIVAYL